jgi:hypothetical protein
MRPLDKVTPHFQWGPFVELRGQVKRGCAVARRSCEHQFDRLKFLSDVRKFGGFKKLLTGLLAEFHAKFTTFAIKI